MNFRTFAEARVDDVPRRDENSVFFTRMFSMLLSFLVLSYFCICTWLMTFLRTWEVRTPIHNVKTRTRYDNSSDYFLLASSCIWERLERASREAIFRGGVLVKKSPKGLSRGWFLSRWEKDFSAQTAREGVKILGIGAIVTLQKEICLDVTKPDNILVNLDNRQSSRFPQMHLISRFRCLGTSFSKEVYQTYPIPIKTWRLRSTRWDLPLHRP